MEKLALASTYKEDILALVEHARLVHGQKTGQPLSDTTISVACFKYGGFFGKFRKWEGGNEGPTLKNLVILEGWLRETMGEKEYKKFIKSRNYASPADSTKKAPAAPPPVDPLDDFGDD